MKEKRLELLWSGKGSWICCCGCCSVVVVILSGAVGDGCWWWLLVMMAVVVVHGWLVIEGWKRDVFAFLLVSCLLLLFSARATSHKTTYDVWCPNPNRFLVNWPTYKSHKAKTLWLLLFRMDDTTEARATLTSVQTWLAKMSCVSPEQPKAHTQTMVLLVLPQRSITGEFLVVT